MQSLEDSVKEIKSTQETILVGLAAIEEAIRNTNTANRRKSPLPFEDSLEDYHDDYDPLTSSDSYPVQQSFKSTIPVTTKSL